MSTPDRIAAPPAVTVYRAENVSCLTHARALIGDHLRMLRVLAATVLCVVISVSDTVSQEHADLAFTAIDGRVIRLGDLHGKVVLVNFWATWCSPCRAEIPILIDLQRQFGGRLVVLGVSEDHGDVAPVRRFAEALRVNYPIIMSTPALARAFSRDANVPTTLVIDREGQIVKKHVGLVDRAGLTLEVKRLAGLADGGASIGRVLRYRDFLKNRRRSRTSGGMVGGAASEGS